LARVNNTIAGQFSGALGGLVFHQKNGKQFVRQRPSSFLPGTDPESVDRRSRFAFSVKLAQAIYSIPELATIWRNAAPKYKAVFNFIVGTNTRRVSAISITDETVIVPPPHLRATKTGLFVVSASMSVSSGAINVELTVPGSSNAKEITGEETVKLLSILSLSKPFNEALRPYMFATAASEPQQIKLDAPTTFSIPLKRQDSSYVESYEERRLLIALATLDDQNKPMDCSDTIIK